jgi:cation diffusion facilitator family transporter
MTGPSRPEAIDEQPAGADGGESTLTVVLALAANGLIAVAKSVAALITGSASMVAESAHSWADTGNEVFLLIAQRRGARPADESHPLGHGRDTYVWSMFAAVGLFTAGAVLSVLHGISALSSPEKDGDFLINYLVLAVAFVLEGASFRQALHQARGEASRWGIHPLAFVYRTSDPTLRAVFLEDSTALVGLLLAGLGVLLHQLTGDAVWDACGSIAVGLLLGVAAVFLIERNRQFLIGQNVAPQIRDRTLQALLDHPQVDRVTSLFMEYVGPLRFFVVAAVDLVGDDAESSLAVRLRALEAQIEEREWVAAAVLTLSTPDEPTLTPDAAADRALGSDG